MMTSRDIIIFDCDGVILNSNPLKTESYLAISQDLLPAEQKKYIAYHRRSGGVSRKEQVEVLVRDYLKKETDQETEVRRRLRRFNSFIKANTHRFELIPGVKKFIKSAYQSHDLYVVTGGDEKEVKYILEGLGLLGYFKRITGSPTKKMEAVRRIMKKADPARTIFFGDAHHDYEVAVRFETQFVFVYGFTDMKSWKPFMKKRKVLCIKDFVNFSLSQR